MDSVINLLNNQGLVCHWLIATFFSFFKASFFFFSPIWMTTFAATLFLVVMKIFIHENKPRMQAYPLELDYCSCMSMLIARGNIASYRDTHIDYLLSKASSRLYIIRICKYYGYSIENLDLLFQSLILSVFTYAIEV